MKMDVKKCAVCSGRGWMIIDNRMSDEFGDNVYDEIVCRVCAGEGFFYD